LFSQLLVAVIDNFPGGKFVIVEALLIERFRDFVSIHRPVTTWMARQHVIIAAQARGLASG